MPVAKVVSMEALEALGFTKEEVFEHVVSTLVHDLIWTSSTRPEEDPETGDTIEVPYLDPTQIALDLREEVKRRIRATVEVVGEVQLGPAIARAMETEKLTWQIGGEAVQMTVGEWIGRAALDWLLRPVDSQGEDHREGRQVRLAWAAEKHMQEIALTSVRNALIPLHLSMVEHLAESVRGVLTSLQGGLEVRMRKEAGKVEVGARCCRCEAPLKVWTVSSEAELVEGKVREVVRVEPCEFCYPRKVTLRCHVCGKPLETSSYGEDRDGEGVTMAFAVRPCGECCRAAKPPEEAGKGEG